MLLERPRQGTGTYGYASDDAGTVEVPDKAQVFRIWCRGGTGGGTVEIDGGDATPVAEDAEVNHLPQLSLVGRDAEHEDGILEIVFTGTVSYIVEWIE